MNNNTTKTVQLLHSKRTLQFVIAIAIPLTILISVLISFSICILNPFVGMFALLLLLLIISYMFNKCKVANGKIDFIDVPTCTIYIITDGVFRLKHKEIKFEKFEKLVCVAEVLYHYRRFRIKGLIDGQEYDLHFSGSRKALNRIVNELEAAFDVEAEYQVSELEIEDYPFTDTSYSFSFTPFSYLFYFFCGAIILILGIVMFTEELFLSCFSIAIGCVFFTYGYNGYFKSKKELSQIKRSR